MYLAPQWARNTPCALKPPRSSFERVDYSRSAARPSTAPAAGGFPPTKSSPGNMTNTFNSTMGANTTKVPVLRQSPANKSFRPEDSSYFRNPYLYPPNPDGVKPLWMDDDSPRLESERDEDEYFLPRHNQSVKTIDLPEMEISEEALAAQKAAEAERRKLSICNADKSINEKLAKRVAMERSIWERDMADRLEMENRAAEVRNSHFVEDLNDRRSRWEHTQAINKQTLKQIEVKNYQVRKNGPPNRFHRSVFGREASWSA
jgi:hypothetical protein